MKHTFAAAISIILALSLGARADIMPAAQQNAVLQQYCGGCHNDARMLGGLSVEHFDAANPEPSVAAMLVSKITSGHTPGEVLEVLKTTDRERIMKLLSGAMGASGAKPDEPTQVAFAEALATEARGADQWDTRWSGKTVTATIVRGLISTKFHGATDMYRLILTCRTDTRDGEIRLAWANGVPPEGQPFTLAVDGNAPVTRKAEGGRQQGNGANGPGATVLYPDIPNLKLPARSLTVRDVFPDETAVFPFDTLSTGARQSLSACF